MKERSASIRTAGDALHYAQQTLRLAEIGSAALDGQLLTMAATGLRREALTGYPEMPVDNDQVVVLEEYIARRLQCEPVAQILGKREFWGLSFAVSRDVLTPRPDSETLIEAAIAAFPDRNAPLRVLDLGTGSGCLLLAFLSEYPEATGLGVDISEAALAVANANAARLGLAERAAFLRSDWWQDVEGQFDAVLCNPPYIGQEERKSLMSDVLDYEPETALFAAENGLAAYRIIFNALAGHLTGTGRAFFEIGASQKTTVEALASARPDIRHIDTLCDLAGHPRCVALAGC